MSRTAHFWPWLITALLVGGQALAAGEDGVYSRITDSPVLMPHFLAFDADRALDLGDREALRILPTGLHAGERLDPRWLLDSRALAIEWQHYIDPVQRLSLSAHYGDQIRFDGAALASSQNSAALGWSRQLDGASQLTGRLFLGDEDAKLRLYGYGSRRYYGLQFEGRYTLWRDHAPFASLSWEHNDYDALDASAAANGTALHSEGISRFSAGWTWQVSPLLDIRAEARYRLTDEVSDPSEQDRTQFFFRSRYGFR